MKKKVAKKNILTEILRQHVENYGLNKASQYSNWVKKTLSPSVDFMCMRKAFFNLKYTGNLSIPANKKDITYEGERAKENGNDFHDRIQAKFKEMDILLLNEYTMEDPEHRIKARIDSLVEIDGEVYLVELKSSKDYSLTLLMDEGGPAEDHQKQIQLYFYLFDVCKSDPRIIEALNGRILNKCIVFYENKNDHTPLEFLVFKDNEIIENTLKYANKLWEHHWSNITPEVPFNEDSPECKYKCSSSYYNQCWKKKKPDKQKNSGIWGYADAMKLAKDPSFKEEKNSSG